MNNFPNVLNVAKAVKHRSTFPLDFQHLTTMDFGKTTVLHAMELVPGDKIDIDLSCVSQLSPLIVPTMGECNLYVRAFFVPFRFVWKDWEEFFSQFSHRKGSTSAFNSVPNLFDLELWQYFISDRGLVEIIPDDREYDFIDDQHRYKLTYKGRLIYQILLGLGYTLYPCSIRRKYYSALPLLCLVKLFRDYYVNPNYDYVTIDNYLNNESWTQSLLIADISAMLDFVAFGWYEGDLFTQAWANPETVGYSDVYKTQSISVVSEGLNLEDIYGPTGTISDSITKRNSSPIESPDITQRSLNILKQIYNFSLRQASSGARYVDQLLSRFGIKLNENEAKRSHFIGSTIFDTQISRVDATSAGTDGTNTSALGDFTGRGILSGNGHFHYENKHNDFGMLIFVAHIMPRTNYYQGVKPAVNHLNFNDFFNPDLEDIGNAPIRQIEVFADWNNIDVLNQDAPTLDGVFGFAPNYYDYKSQQSYLTGDFRCKTLNKDLESFQLFRTLCSPRAPEQGATPAELNENFQKFNERNVTDWNRIFLNQSNDADHFICSFMFRQRVTRYMNSLGNSLLAELNEHGNDVGDIIKVRPNGKYF